MDNLAGAAERCERMESELSRLRSQVTGAKADQQALQQLQKDYARVDMESKEHLRHATLNEERVKQYRVNLASSELALNDLKASAARKARAMLNFGVVEREGKEKME